MMSAQRTVCAAIAALSLTAAVRSPSAWADEIITYEVVSDSVGVASIEYQDVTGRLAVQSVDLPWRIDVMLSSPLEPPPNGSQVRADWRPVAAPTRWVTVRIIYRGKTVCQNTLDIGNATCYGITPRIT